MAGCWESRGCDAEMQATCPHALKPEFKCPARCGFAQCDLPQHERTSDPALVFDPVVDRTAAVKEVCTFCAHFLTRGPRG